MKLVSLLFALVGINPAIAANEKMLRRVNDLPFLQGEDATVVIQTIPTRDVESEDGDEMKDMLKVFPHLQGARHGFCQKNSDCGGGNSGCDCDKTVSDNCSPPDTNPPSGCCVCSIDKEEVEVEEELEEKSEKMIRGANGLPYLQAGEGSDVCRRDHQCDSGCTCNKGLDDPFATCGATGNKGCCDCPVSILPHTEATKPATTTPPPKDTDATVVIQTIPTRGVESEDGDEMKEMLMMFPHLQGARHGFCQKDSDCGGKDSGCDCDKTVSDNCSPPDTNPASGCCVC